jgi:hypothetical protein
VEFLAAETAFLNDHLALMQSSEPLAQGTTPHGRDLNKACVPNRRIPPTSPAPKSWTCAKNWTICANREPPPRTDRTDRSEIARLDMKSRERTPPNTSAKGTPVRICFWVEVLAEVGRMPEQRMKELTG